MEPLMTAGKAIISFSKPGILGASLYLVAIVSLVFGPYFSKETLALFVVPALLRFMLMLKH